MSAPVDVLAVMDDEIASLPEMASMASVDGVECDPTEAIARMTEARAAVAELVDKADAVAGTLEMPTLVKQSTKNPNAGFIDWRDWCALQGEVAALRSALARVGGGK